MQKSLLPARVAAGQSAAPKSSKPDVDEIWKVHSSIFAFRMQLLISTANFVLVHFTAESSTQACEACLRFGDTEDRARQQA